MALSIKSIGGVINEVPKVSNLRVVSSEQKSIEIEYSVEDIELTICRHYLLLNGEKKEITKEVGYESESNIFRYTITGLTRNTTYTVQIVCDDGLDKGNSESIQASTKFIQLYGFRIDTTNSNPKTSVTYLDDAIGIETATPTTYGGWKNKFPFDRIRPCGFKNGKVVKYIQENDFTKYIDGTTVGSDVDVMIEFPKIYWSSEKNEQYIDVRISDEKIDSSYDCLAHKKRTTEFDYIYIAAYNASYDEQEKARSISGKKPYHDSWGMANWREACKKKGYNYTDYYYYAFKMLQILFVLMYKNLNSQEALGKGRVGQTSGTNTGGTDKKGMIYGSSINSQQMKFLGIEDLWGNYYNYIDGIYLEQYGYLYICNDYADFGDWSSYESTKSIPGSSYKGFVNNVYEDSKNLFIPKATSGSGNTYFCDNADIFSSRHAYGDGTEGSTGSYWGSNIQEAGIFSINLNVMYLAPYQINRYASRLVHFGTV